MAWQDLLENENDRVVLPWLGGRVLRSSSRTWTIEGPLPREYGWYSWKLTGRRASEPRFAEADQSALTGYMAGYLVGDRFAADTFIREAITDPITAAQKLPRVHLIEDGLDRFARANVGMVHEDGPLIYRWREMPLGPEDDALRAYEDRKPNLDDIKGVTPELDVAFRMETFQRAEAERRRAELERIRAEEEAKRVAEERRQELLKKLGDGAGRRELAKLDFDQAARAALAVGSAELLDWKRAGKHAEWIVKYRLDGQRFECVCDANLRIIDAGICLNDYRTGEKGDTKFTLESLPAVVRQAERDGVLVVFRHV